MTVSTPQARRACEYTTINGTPPFLVQLRYPSLVRARDGVGRRRGVQDAGSARGKPSPTVPHPRSEFAVLAWRLRTVRCSHTMAKNLKPRSAESGEGQAWWTS